MREIEIREYDSIPRAELGGTLLRRLQRFDEGRARSSGDCIFDWSRLRDIRAKNYVGVAQVPGLRVEILPKIDDARDNLLYMLAFTRNIPIHERDLASLRLRKMPLLEALLRIFVESLLRELRRGIEHDYVRREANSRFVRGKLLLSEHARRNAARKDRVYVAYDEFLPDTILNRILKAACRRLIAFTALARTRQRLSEALLYLAAARDSPIRPHHFKTISLDRNEDRFRELLEFCRIVLFDSTAAPAAGASNTFSLLFPMEVLFEEFIARFIWRHAERFGYARPQVHIQAANRSKWLLRDSGGGWRFRLKPDIILGGGEHKSPRLILDTKWKRLKADVEDSKNGVRQADLYQMYAYAHRYGSADNVLLYPRVDGATAKKYHLAGEDGKVIRVEFINLNRDLRKDQAAFGEELRAILACPQAIGLTWAK